MSGHVDAPPAKATRTTTYPMNPPMTLLTNPSQSSNNNFTQLQKLQALNVELESQNRELRSIIRDTIKDIRDDLKTARSHGAKLQGEIAAIKRPRRRTTLRMEVEGLQGNIDELEGELRNARDEITLLRGISEAAERDRDHWKSLFEETQKRHHVEQMDQLTPPLNYNEHVNQTIEQNNNQLALHLSNGEQMNDAIQQNDTQLTLPPSTSSMADHSQEKKFNGLEFPQSIPYPPEEPKAESSSVSQHTPVIAPYQSSESTIGNLSLPANESTPDSFPAEPNPYLEGLSWEPDHGADSEIDIDALLEEFGYNPSAN
ncbi:uncharacterized protein GGS25DRAFT_521268 [Hypoxylon fragiforme]|uniref:uncharacterized protein n=1 Tax=Hypoxylon fragiforme TaxID=63214 RepID=UPI0020C63595|nr:uncharacterized protein GGS25DRAFT_521268 [Hypoxylon fragiforme]KAI2608101.1 hypothetical protein GGS25DRAFT_521268 [Hypoxylon fragiforme]